MTDRMTAWTARQTHARQARDAAKRAARAAGRRAPERLPGLYDRRLDHDSCGVGFIADLKGGSSHQIVANGLQILENLTHRGAVGADPLVGDGAGMLIQIPHEFLQGECAALGFSLPEPGDYGVGFLFMPRDDALRAHYEEIVERVVAAEGQKLLGWRNVPVDNSSLSQDPAIRASEPVHRQVFIGRGEATEAGDAFERRLFILRKVISNAVFAETKGADTGFYIVSMSSRTLVYKGMFLAYQLGAYFRDLHDPRFASQMALVHQRFSTNTFPSWKLAHPYRMVAHNGEINTLRGNVNWMAARQASVASPLFGDEIEKLWPISYEGQSDTACFDNALEFLVMGGYELAACGDDADPRSLGGQPAHGRGPARLLRVPRRADGAVGRPGRHGLLRRPPDRRDARPQRAEAGPLRRDRRRHRHHGVGGRRAAGAGIEDRLQVAPAAGQDAAHRPGEGLHRLRRRAEAAPRHGQPLPQVGRPHADRAGGPAPRRLARARARTRRCSIASRPSATRRKT